MSGAVLHLRVRPGLALLACLGLCLASLWLLVREARAQALVADLSEHLVAITTGFTGTDVVLFGAVDGPGAVALVVQGPEAPVSVRRKGRVAGIWVNTEEMEFDRVPAYYSLALSQTLEEMAPPAVLQRHEIGLDHVRLVPKHPTSAEEVAAFRAALIRNKQRDGLYSTAPQDIVFLGQRLFSTRIHFPANVPTGTYMASVFLIRDGDVVSAQTTPLTVSKIGFSASVSDYAQRYGMVYAAVAILLAVSAGWLAGVIFRKS